MEWSDVRIFLAVARCGSLGSAARVLRLSHPTVGRRLRALEEKIGQVLFQRHSEGVVLTKPGEAILRLAEEMESNALAIQRRLVGARGQFEGELRISSAGWFATYALPPVLKELSLQYPGVVPKLIASHRPFDLSRGEADIAFRVTRFDEPDVVQRRLMRMTYGLYAPKSVPDPKLGDGAGSALLLMDTSEYAYPDVDWVQEVLPRARAVFSSNCRSLQARLCAQGLGVAVLPRPVGDQTPGLRLVDLGIEPPSRDFWVGYHRDLRQIKPLRAMLDIALRLLGGIDPADPEHS
ncbi:LysR family transcriptional regulator [Dokdonella sp.]|uniref:LysR family transcriptional regulator n=1 Tax=Dokdonella sp. TaxID=2291710 RepID=UPI001B102EF4|nr:LysR family transcriptional regulator [Dokdonella sp.]MBO9662256.1 LysR family transcriptional regulator [Dokdonella sp.]